MAQRDYYEVLDVARDAPADAIKKAYRALARKYHPDVNPGDKKAEAKFKEAQQAYDVLSDTEKRALYDQFGTAAFEGMAAGGPRPGGGGPGPGWSARQAGPQGGFENIDFSEFFAPGEGAEAGGGGIFEELIGRMRGGKGPRRGAAAPPRAGRNVEAHLTIPFLTAVRGGETTIDLEREDGRRESLVVKIPPGIESGAKLRLRGQGELGPDRNAPRGDLTILVAVEPHVYFQRDGRNLTVEVPITIAEAALGAKIEAPTLDGLRSLTVPPGSSSGLKLRLRGQGIPASGGKPEGDLFVVLKVVVPKTIDEASRNLITEFAERNPQRPETGSGEARPAGPAGTRTMRTPPEPILPRDEAAARFAIPTRVLIRYEARGLIRAVRRDSDEIEGYGPAELRRLWAIVSYQRDLGVNLAGVEAILKLRDHMAGVHRHLDALARDLRTALDESEAETEVEAEPDA